MTKIHGLNVVTSEFLTESRVVPRTRKERWVSWPWRPWVRTKTIHVPSRKFLVTDSILYCHPSMLREARSVLEKTT